MIRPRWSLGLQIESQSVGHREGSLWWTIRVEPDVIDGAIRVSFSRYNTAEDCEGFVTCLKLARDQLSHR